LLPPHKLTRNELETETKRRFHATLQDFINDASAKLIEESAHKAFRA